MKYCKRCKSDTERNKSGKCKPCDNVNSAKYRAANINKERASDAKYRSANSDKVRASNAKWVSVNPDKVRASAAKWAASNKNACRIIKQNRRSRKRASGGTLSKDLSSKLLKLQRGKCPCCNQPLGDNYHLDHIMPLALEGLNIDSNMQLLRATCNQQKHASHPIDFMQSRGFLL